MNQEKIDKLTSMFKGRYSKLFLELNKNVYPAALTQAGTYEAPAINLGSGGFVVVPEKADAFQLPPPAVVDISTLAHKATLSVYRVAIPTAELNIALEKPEYFNYLMDRVLGESIARFREMSKTNENVLRFGTCFCSADLPNGGVFRVLNDDYLELRLFGQWATNEIAGV